MFAMRTRVIMPVRLINTAIRDACRVTAYGVAKDFRDYMLLRFSEPKSGRLRFVPGRGWYRASAPGEYPAIKYGILYQSMKVQQPKFTELSATTHVGAARFSKAIFGGNYGNDPDYARELEGLEGDGPTRPYFVRAFLETRAERPNNARAYFLGHLYGKAIKAAGYRGTANPIQSVDGLGDPMELLGALGGKTFKDVSDEVAREVARTSTTTGIVFR